jgi:IS5 family transposase
MSEQRTLASVVYDSKRKVTRRERFLQEMDRVIPWTTLIALVAPHYVKPGRGRRPMPLETMLRIYFLQHWFNLSDPQAEDLLYDSESMRRFARVALGEDTVPDESTILRFRHLLEAHQLTAAMFEAVRDLLVDRDLLMTTGTIVDATLSAAPSSTKNTTKTRDPEMRQTRKGNPWYFGMKCHVGTDPQGFVHTRVTTDAAHSDIGQLPHLVHGLEETLHGDQAYWKEADRVAYEAAGGQYLVNQRGERPPERDAMNRERSRVRARGEHAFHVVKVWWGFTTVRYRGLMKNTVRALAAFALANLFLARKRLAPAGTSCRRECRPRAETGPPRPGRSGKPERRPVRSACHRELNHDVIPSHHTAHLCRVSLVC